MVIVEGMDNTGKTTLIEQISKEFRLPIIKSYRPKAVYDIHQFNNWANAAPRTPVLDRHPAISDLVYGTIIRGESPSSLELAQSSRNNHVLIYCCPSLEVIRSTFQDRQQMEGVEDNLTALFRSYENLMEQLEPEIYYDFTNPRAYQALIRNLQGRLA